jgi:hypothetical protein
MAGVSFPVKRPIGRALIVGMGSSRSQPLAAMQRLEFTCAEAEDPYAAAIELFRRPLVYRALVFSLTSLYREELALIGTLKRRLPHLDIWLTHIDSRQSALAEAMRQGADGLLGEDGALHRMALPQTSDTAARPTVTEYSATGATSAHDVDEMASGEPVLSAEELRALLQEQPSSPPDADS